MAGHKAPITGADRGIGRAAAFAFARERADVGINDLPQEELDAKEVLDLIEAQAAMASASREICEMKRDLCDYKDIRHHWRIRRRLGDQCGCQK